MFIVLSDLHDSGALASLKRLGQRHDCAVLQLRDPSEREGLIGSGFLRAREAETGRSFVTRGRAHWLAEGRVESELKRAGIDHLMIDTDQPFASRLRHFFKARNLLGRGAR
jgi:hypothetical protein